MRRLPRWLLLGLAGPAFAAAAQQGAPRGPDLELTGRWHSRYVSEGRDNLAGDDLYTVSGGLQWDGWAAGGWLGVADGRDYREVNLFIERAFDAGPVDLFGRYTRVHYLSGDSNDDEVAAGFRTQPWDFLGAAAEYRYSTLEQGGFADLSLSAGTTVFSGGLTLASTFVQAYDFGYASPEFDGANNRQVTAEATLHLSEELRLVGTAGHSWAQTDVERSGGGDVSWFSVGVSTDL